MYKKTIERFASAGVDFYWHTTMREDAARLAITPHPKRKLRENAWSDLNITGDVGRKVWLKSCWWKFKQDEIAKPGKYGRLIVDLGVSASLQGAGWAEHVKKTLGDREVVYNDCCFVFCTQPHPEEVMHYFNRLWDNEYRVYMLVFSDDACISVKGKGVRRCANLDFSSCDSSHNTELFEMFFDIFKCPADVRAALIKQILSPIRVKDKWSKDMVILKPLEMYLQSGITITTVINVTAWLLCFTHLAITHCDAMEDIERRVRECGYLVTTANCDKFEDLQFLKMSPTMDVNGIYHAVLNLGVIFRSSGVCRGDLPGRGDIRKRAADFQSSLMNGMLLPIDNETLGHLNPGTTTTVTDPSLYSSSLYLTQFHNSARYAYSDEALFRRYDLLPWELAELQYVCRNVGCMQTVYSSAVGKILLKDYGLDLPGPAVPQGNEPLLV